MFSKSFSEKFGGLTFKNKMYSTMQGLWEAYGVWPWIRYLGMLRKVSIIWPSPYSFAPQKVICLKKCRSPTEPGKGLSVGSQGARFACDALEAALHGAVWGVLKALQGR